jgi:hypothetical protein
VEEIKHSQILQSKNLKGRDNLGELGVDGREILKRVLNK